MRIFPALVASLVITAPLILTPFIYLAWLGWRLSNR